METGAAAGPVSDLYAAAMRQNDGLADGQPEPVAGHACLLGRWFAEERFENAFAILGRDARPLILY